MTSRLFILAALPAITIATALPQSLPQIQLSTPSASTQTSTPPAQAKLALATAIDAAEANYPKVRAALEQQNAAQATIGVAQTTYLPRIDVLWQTNRATANNIYGLLLPQSNVPSISGPVIPSDFNRSAWSSAGGTLLSWQPFDFGARAAQVNVARQGSQAARAGLNLTRLEVAVLTANAYFDLVTAKQLAATADSNVNRLQVFARSVSVLVENQLRPGADAAQAEAQLAFSKTQLIQAQTNLQVRRAVLAELVGRPVGDLDDAQLLATPSEQPIPAIPIADHPAARQEAAFVAQQQARLSFLNRSYVPQFNLQGSVSGRGAGTNATGIFAGGSNGLAPDTPNWAVGIQMTFPAFDFFSLREQKKVQSANVRAEQARYSQVLDDLSVQVLQAQAQLAGAMQVARNTPTELAAAQQSETQQRARFQSGLATVIDVAAAESVLVQAEADDAVARLNVWRALAAVAAARGDLTPFLTQLGTSP